MKKSRSCTLTLILAIPVAFFGNFESVWNGDPPTIWNFLLSALYLAAWVWFLREKDSKRALWFFRIWWTMALTGAVLCCLMQTDYHLEGMFFVGMPLNALTLTQLFGLKVLIPGNNYALVYLIYTSICGVMLWLGIRKMKKLHYR